MSADDFDYSACLDLVRAGNERAGCELVTALHPTVMKIVHSHLPRRDTPEDLAQEIFIKMFSRLHQFRGDVPFPHWVSRVALTTCLDHLRAQQRRPELRWADLSEEQQQILENAAEPFEQPAVSEAYAARELVQQLLNGLDAEDRITIQLLDLDRKSVAEIQTLTGWSASRIKVRAFRARNKMKIALKKLEKNDEQT